MDDVWYFAYGAMMSPEVVRRRGIDVIEAEVAAVRDYRLVFDIRGISFVEPAFASVTESPGSAVHGMLYRLTPAAMDRLDSYEGPEYRRIDVAAMGVASGEVSARTYQTLETVDGLAPSRRYLRVLCDAARVRGLPADYIAALEQQPSVYIPVLSQIAQAVLGIAERIVRASNRRKRNAP